jgi:hypothetical protein
MAFPLRPRVEEEVEPGGCEITKMCNCWEGDPLPGITAGTSGLLAGGGGTFSDINDGSGCTVAATGVDSSWLLPDVGGESLDSRSNI